MKNTYKVEYCADCEMPISQCQCRQEEIKTCCPRCSILLDVIDEIINAENTEEALEILRDFVDGCEESAHQEGYIEGLRNQAMALLDLADELECENCDGCDEE